MQFKLDVKHLFKEDKKKKKICIQLSLKHIIVR